MNFIVSNKITTKERNRIKEIPYKKSYTQEEVGLLNPVVNDGPLSERELWLSLDNYFHPPEKNAIGIVTFSNKLKNQKLGKLRINSNNMKMYFPTDKEYMNISSKLFNETLLHETLDFGNTKEALNIISNSEKPENFNINPYSLILENESLQATKLKNETLYDEFDFTKNNKNKKNLLQLSLEEEEKIYRHNLSTLKDKYVRYNRQIQNPILKNNMNGYNSYKTHRIDRNDHMSNGFQDVVIDNNNNYYKYN